MNKICKYALLIIASVALLASCFKYKSESADDIQLKILDAYLELNYGGQQLEKWDSGIYVLDKVEGTGAKPKNEGGAYIYLVNRYLDGTVLTGNAMKEELHRQLGIYSPTTLYTPVYYAIGKAGEESVMDKILLSMKEGGSYELLVPSKLNSERGQLGRLNEILEIEMIEVVDDIMQYQIDNLERFSEKYYDGVDSLKKGFYFKKIEEKPGADTVAYDADGKIHYIGRYLNGKVFDTSIRDTARKHSIYDASRDYSPLTIKWVDGEEKMVENNSSYVPGFVMGVRDLKKGEKGVAFFWSDFGYGTAGKTDSYGGGIKPFMPLFFELWLSE